MSTCDDRQVPKPATGKTPVRNARIPDEVWLPALAKAESMKMSASDAITEALIQWTATPAPSAYEFKLANWPGATVWVHVHGGALEALNRDLSEALGPPVPPEWLAVAAWLASTLHPADAAQQKRIITGHVLRRFGDARPVVRKYRDSRHLSETVQAVLDRHLPLDPGPI